MEDLTDVYNELIMEHSMNSYNKKKLEGDTTIVYSTLKKKL